MTIRRSAAAVGAVALGLLALSACSKPTPVATVTVGDDTVNSQAACYDGGKVLAESNLSKCLSTEGGKSLTVDSSNNVHIGVDPSIADKGWFLVFNQQPTPVMKQTYRTFNGASLFVDSETGQVSTKPVLITLVESADGTTSKIAGVWQFKLTPKS